MTLIRYSTAFGVPIRHGMKQDATVVWGYHFASGSLSVAVRI
jgi:hypothetical protein